MRTPKTLLIAGTLVLVSLATFWWNQRTTTATRTATTTTQVVEHAVAAKSTAPALSPAPVPIAAAVPPAKPKPTAKPRTMALQSPENIPTQHFRVRSDRDTLLTSKGGCTVKVPANAFVTASGGRVKGAVDLQLREVLKPVDFVMGNMVTLYKGKALESGGSFCLEANANGEALALAEGKLIDMAIPTRGAKSGMKVFPGKVDGDAVEWLEPRDLMLPVVVKEDKTESGGQVVMEAIAMDRLVTNVWYRVDGFDHPNKAPAAVHTAVGNFCWKDKGLLLKKDTTMVFAGHRVFMEPGDTTVWGAFGNPVAATWDEAVDVAVNDAARAQRTPGNGLPAITKGTNAFKVDPAANYIFQVKALGWANIDRLMYDKRSRPVDIITRVDNKDVGEVYISMVVKSHSIYLPGYEMKNGGYCFSHGDYEKMQLPIGAKATILATAYADGKPYVSIQDIVIAEKLNVDLHLEPTTKEELRGTLEARL